MTDTHFHFHHLVTERGLDGEKLLSDLYNNNTPFALDIGTKSDDLLKRQILMEENLKKCDKNCERMIYFSAGIWPAAEEIKNKENAVKELEKQIENARNSENPLYRKVAALGECGLDRHWNKNNPDAAMQDEKFGNEELLKAEEELFKMQLELASRLNLPVIVHSRDAAQETINCIKDARYNRGIIHCYSYGLEEAKIFLDLGWHISFSGSVTYTKKSKMEEMSQLLRYIPDDRILCETDSPYLAPVPHRGVTNTPLLVDFVYEFVAKERGIEKEALHETVNKNVKKLFSL